MRVNQYVKEKRTSHYSKIKSFDGDYAILQDGSRVLKANLKEVKPLIITSNDLRNYFRMNDFYMDNVEDPDLEDNFICLEKYVPNIDDLKALLMNIKIKEIYTLELFEWYLSMTEIFSNQYFVPANKSKDEVDRVLIKTEGDLFSFVLNELFEATHAEADPFMFVNEIIDIDELITVVQGFVQNQNSDTKTYPDRIKKDFIEYADDKDQLEILDDKYKQLYKQFVLELVEKKDLLALTIYGYACYGGNAVFDWDWYKAEETIKYLYDKTGGAEYANTLGYIYYYGRTNNGIAQDDKAFYYFSIGAAGGNYESSYKQADMLYYGRGVVENKRMAVEIYYNLYRENKKILEDGFFDCKFADIALRIGTIFTSDGEPDYELAYFYLLQADYAMKQKQKIASYYGDDKVAKKISEALDNCRTHLDYKNEKTLTFIEPAWIQDMIREKNRVKITTKKLKNNDVKMMMETLADANGKVYNHLFTCVNFELCMLTDKVTCYAKHVENSIEDGQYIITHYVTNHDQDKTTFYYYDKPVLEIVCSGYAMHKPKQ